MSILSDEIKESTKRSKQLLDENIELSQDLDDANELCKEYVFKIVDLNTQLIIVQEELIESNDKINQMRVEKDQMRVEKDQMRVEKDQMQVEKDQMQVEKDQKVLKLYKRICKHITFFYTENNKDVRLGYINRIIDEVQKYRYTTDIFIHTNVDFSKDLLHKNKNGYTYIIAHDLIGDNPYKLAWKCRELLKKQRDEYDIFMYVEDDILVYNDALEYWFENKDFLLRNEFKPTKNSSFSRIEIDEYATEFIKKLGKFLVYIEGTQYLINNMFPDCAFWVYDKTEFNKWVDTFSDDTPKGYDIREQSAVAYLDYAHIGIRRQSTHI